jgi:hypothetical protein
MAHTIYRLANGDRVPSVTTILGVLNKPALITWAWKCGMDGVDYRTVRDSSAGIGTLTHALITDHLLRKPTDMHEFSQDTIDVAEDLFAIYLDWERGHDIKCIEIEKPLVCEATKFGGTLDFYGTIDGKLTLMDFKTTGDIYPEQFYQLSAYRHLLISNEFEDPVDIKILRIGRDGSGIEERSLQNLDQQFAAFIACKIIYDIQHAPKEKKKAAKK